VTDQPSNIVAGRAADEHAETPKGAIAFEDAALVQRTRKGDMQAFALLVAKYQDRIFNLILRMCPRRAEAEELAQDTFLRAMERIGQFRGNSKFYTWLFRIAANLTISHLRRAGRVRFQSLSGPRELEGSQADALTSRMAERRQAGPPAAAMRDETRRRVERALLELDEEFRLVVILRDMENMDYGEISQATGLPSGTVKSRLHRAREALREKLADLIDTK
jgi:RNA polymerase sigma-70 factor, ECF subfamily